MTCLIGAYLRKFVILAVLSIFLCSALNMTLQYYPAEQSVPWLLRV